MEDFNEIPLNHGSKVFFIKEILQRIFVLNYYEIFDVNLKIKNLLWKDELVVVNDFLKVEWFFGVLRKKEDFGKKEDLGNLGDFREVDIEGFLGNQGNGKILEKKEKIENDPELRKKLKKEKKLKKKQKKLEKQKKLKKKIFLYYKKEYKNVICLIDKYIVFLKKFDNNIRNKQEINLLIELKSKIVKEMEKEEPMDLRSFADGISNFDNYLPGIQNFNEPLKMMNYA